LHIQSGLIIIVIGPIYSGKTTKRYAVLSSGHSPDIMVISIDGPVEYHLDGISQIQVNPKIDLTFARGFRSIMRMDGIRKILSGLTTIQEVLRVTGDTG